MENKNVAAFIKVVEFNNFTKAAESMGYSQAAVTAQIKSLEKELGVLLFDRMGKKICLTQEGKAFLPYAYNILKAEEEAKNSVKTDGELRGEIRICAGSSYAMGVLPEIILKFKELHPNVNVIVKISDYPEDTTQKLARGEIDFLVCMDEENAYPEFLTVSKKREPVIFVTHPGNPLLEKNNMTLEEAVSNQYITSDRDIG
ncbi:MAG: LysR family transcriptional regulator, partial [Firmicutes bacterium]|nr:LysR family transcriptional regulator [Bacillota bacterium]